MFCSCCSHYHHRQHCECGLCALHVERSIISFAHHTPAQAYLGFTWRSGAGFDTEIARWAVAPASAITRLDGEPIGGRRDLEDLNFRVRFCVLMFCVQPHFPQVEILIQNSVAFNMRVVETALHRKFHQNLHRLWQKIGAGSYYMPQRRGHTGKLRSSRVVVWFVSRLQQYQKDNALISSVFIVYAPRSAAAALAFKDALPISARV